MVPGRVRFWMSMISAMGVRVQFNVGISQVLLTGCTPSAITRMTVIPEGLFCNLSPMSGAPIDEIPNGKNPYTYKKYLI